MDEEATTVVEEQSEAPQSLGLFKPDADDPVLPEAEPEPEAATPEPEPEKEEPDSLKRSLNDLVRREAELLQRERRFSSLAKAQKALEEGDDLEAARLMGIDHNRLLSKVWGEELVPEKKQPEPAEEVQSIKQELASLKQELAATRAHTAKQQLYTQIGKEMAGLDLEVVPMLVSESGEAFYDNLLQYAYEQEKELGKRPDWKEVLQYAEDAYTENYCTVAQKLIQLPKVRQRLGLGELKQAQPKQPPATPAKKLAAPPRTLTNKLNSTEPRQESRPMNDEERREAALAALRGAIKRDED
jgi:hypothetical protein